MDLTLLENFLVVARTENISSASRLLHISQPALSRQIQQLEEELNVPLFEHGRRLVLNDHGRILQERAAQIIKLMEKTRQEMSLREYEGPISIGTGGLNSSRVLPVLMEDFRRKNPKVYFEIYTNSVDRIIQAMDQGLLDFGLLLEPVDTTRFEFIRLNTHETWGLLVRSDSKLARKEFISRDDLLQETLALPDRHAIRKEFENWLQKPISELDCLAQFNIIPNVVSLVENGCCSALTIAGAVANLNPEILTFRPLEPELSMTSILAWKKTLSLQSPAYGFLESFRTFISMQETNNNR